MAQKGEDGKLKLKMIMFRNVCRDDNKSKASAGLTCFLLDEF